MIASFKIAGVGALLAAGFASGFAGGSASSAGGRSSIERVSEEPASRSAVTLTAIQAPARFGSAAPGNRPPARDGLCTDPTWTFGAESCPSNAWSIPVRGIVRPVTVAIRHEARAGSTLVISRVETPTVTAEMTAGPARMEQ